MKIKAHTVSSLLTCWPPRTPLVLYASHFLMAFESDDIFNEGAEQKTWVVFEKHLFDL